MVPRFLLPLGFKLLRIHIPAICHVTVAGEDMLESGWRQDVSYTQSLGDRWIRSASTPLLKVPSAVCEGHNYVINSVHRNADFIEVVEIMDPFQYEY